MKKKGKNMGGGEEMEVGKEIGVYGPFPTSSAVTPRHDTQLPLSVPAFS